MSKFEGFESYKGTIKKDDQIIEENAYLIYDDERDRFLSYFRKDGDVTRLNSLGATFSLAMDFNVLSLEEIKELEKVIDEESLPYGTDMEGYYIDESTIVLDSPLNKKGRSK